MGGTMAPTGDAVINGSVQLRPLLTKLSQSGHLQRAARLAAGRLSSLFAVSSIGVMREGPLHAAIKARLARPGDRLEVPVGRFVIDLVRADGELVEVQTGGFGALGPKLDGLLDEHRVRIVQPVAADRRILRIDEQGRSPRSVGPQSVPTHWRCSTSSSRSPGC